MDFYVFYPQKTSFSTENALTGTHVKDTVFVEVLKKCRYASYNDFFNDRNTKKM